MLLLTVNELGFLTMPSPALYMIHEIIQGNTRKLLKVRFPKTLLHGRGATNTDTVFFTIMYKYKLNFSLNDDVGVVYSLGVRRAILEGMMN